MDRIGDVGYTEDTVQWTTEGVQEETDSESDSDSEGPWDLGHSDSAVTFEWKLLFSTIILMYCLIGCDAVSVTLRVLAVSHCLLVFVQFTGTLAVKHFRVCSINSKIYFMTFMILYLDYSTEN